VASTEAIQTMQAIFERVDDHVRELLPPGAGAEVDSINVLIGDGVNPIVAGVAAALRVDFRARVTGYFLQEFDGTSGSVAVNIERAVGGASPTWSRISASTPAGISSGRYFADEILSTWSDTAINRGDYLRFSVASATSIKRVHLALRIRRLEP
jgi:hypothetical protein